LLPDIFWICEQNAFQNQEKVNSGTMRTVGILVNEKVLHQIRRGIPGSERFDLYNRAALGSNLVPVYISLERINLRTRTVSGYRYSGGTYRYVTIPVPRVVYNRALPASRQMRAQLNGLNRIAHVFNAKNRQSKYKIHRLLQRRFRAHLPFTVPYSRSNLRRMMARYRMLYIKPQNSSLGMGIMRLTRVPGQRWHVKLAHRSMTVPYAAAVNAVQNRVGRRAYLIQQGIPLARYQGRVYDIRVTVQRGGDGNWRVVGMLGRVADRGNHVTNLAQGGLVRRAESLLHHNFARPHLITASIRRLSLGIANHLGRRLRNLADIGLDIGVDRSGKPYFIEMNCRALRKGYERAGMIGTLRQVYANPMRYAGRILRARRR
jgi:glutathione synthase/RimK-type ligase-like ATP-grasp enzyme